MDNQNPQSTPPIQNTPVDSSPTQQVPLKATKSFLSNKLILIAIVILIVLLAGGGAYFVLNSKTKSQSVVSKTTPASVPSSAPSLTPDPTVNWKTYINSTFSIKYPNSWFQNETFQGPRQRGKILGGVSTTDFSDKNPSASSYFVVGFELDTKDSLTTLSDYASKIACLRGSSDGSTQTNCSQPKKPTSQESITVDGKQAIRQEIITIAGPTLEVYIPLNDTQIVVVYTFAGTTDGQSINQSFITTFNQILSTFKFTDANQTGCNTDNDCQNGAKCMAVGPIIANQPVHKVCVQKGQVVPL